MMSFMLQTYPDTLDYMIAGYAVIFVMMSLYLLSIFIRHRQVSRRLKALKDDLD